eukprot:CAMPEP_0197029784 /NCGR_PEP_ID=MMETSP1384-20130603/9163_1 /TAXON_ID=29189 /ORGANISM="Ammonia sp." /LENGTH=219 /DNA_ID=CAMNT_0042459021 /DNA_START=48 /DNA_END=707 /DNA_ORIENTATION=+
MSAEENQVWDLYIQDKGIRPKNAAQLMKWSKAHDNAANLSFSAAKQVFANRSKEPVEEKTPPDAADRPKVDMTAEKEELKEYISECKEELVSLQNRDLSMEDDYYEGLEGLETQFDELEAQLKKARADITALRQQKYDTIQKRVKAQKETLENTLRILRVTLSECDIKGDKEEVKKVLSSLPQMEDVEEYQFQPINIEPVQKALEALQASTDNAADNKQ